MSQLPGNPYSTPASAHQPVSGKPGLPKTDPSFVLMWQRIYVILMTLLYVVSTAFSFFLFAYATDLEDQETSAGEAMAMGAVLAIISLGLVALYGVGLFWRRGNGGWIYQIILIAIGLTSCATWPLTIPLIIGWIKHRDAIIHYE